MRIIKNAFVVCALFFLTACSEETTKYTETDFNESQALIEKVIAEFEANEKPNNTDRENYHLAKTIKENKLFLGTWKRNKSYE